MGGNTLVIESRTCRPARKVLVNDIGEALRCLTNAGFTVTVVAPATTVTTNATAASKKAAKTRARGKKAAAAKSAPKAPAATSLFGAVELSV